MVYINKPKHLNSMPTKYYVYDTQNNNDQRRARRMDRKQLDKFVEVCPEKNR